MTVAACYHSNDGVVLGSDSAETITPAVLNGVYAAIRQFNHAQKVYEIGSESKIGPMAVAAYGIGSLAGKGHRTMTAEFADNLEGKPPKSMDEVATRWSEMIWSAFVAAYANQYARYKELLAKAIRTDVENIELAELAQITGGHLLGGRLNSNRQTNAYRIDYNFNLDGPPVPTPIVQGSMSVAGVPSVFTRIVKGFDENTVLRILASGKWIGSPEELVNAL